MSTNARFAAKEQVPWKPSFATKRFATVKDDSGKSLSVPQGRKPTELPDFQGLVPKGARIASLNPW